MNKKYLSESDLCDKYIRPAMVQAGWHGIDQIYREFPLRAGRVVDRVAGQHRQPHVLDLLDLGRDRRQELEPARLAQVARQPGRRRGDAVDAGQAHGVPSEVVTVIRLVSNTASCRVEIAIVVETAGAGAVPM